MSVFKNNFLLTSFYFPDFVLKKLECITFIKFLPLVSFLGYLFPPSTICLAYTHEISTNQRQNDQFRNENQATKVVWDFLCLAPLISVYKIVVEFYFNHCQLIYYFCSHYQLIYDTVNFSTTSFFQLRK